MKMAKVFISYRRTDSEAISGRIFDRLCARIGAHCVFRDVNAISPGMDFVESIRQAIDECEVFLVVIGNNWASVRDDSGLLRLQNVQDHVRAEVEAALAGRRIRVIPVLVGGATMPKEDELPESLAKIARLNATMVRGGSDFEPDMGRLITAICQPQRRNWRIPTMAMAALAVIVTLFALARFLPYRSANPDVLEMVFSQEPRGLPVGMGETRLQLNVFARRNGDTDFRHLSDGDTLFSHVDLYSVYASSSRRGYLYVFQIDSNGRVTWMFPRNASVPFSTGSNPVQPAQVIAIPPSAEQGLFLDDVTGIERIVGVFSPVRWRRLESDLGRAAQISATFPKADQRRPRTRGVGGVRRIESPSSVSRNVDGQEITLQLEGLEFTGNEGHMAVVRYFRHE